MGLPTSSRQTGPPAATSTITACFIHNGDSVATPRKRSNHLKAHSKDFEGSKKGAMSVPASTVRAKEFAASFAREVYVWGLPIGNAFHPGQSFSIEPEPELRGGMLPAAPNGYV